MWNLYGLKGDNKRLVATFDSEQQLLAYVNYATLKHEPDGAYKFEQQTPLSSYTGFTYDRATSKSDDPDLPHNPSPTML